MGKVKKFVNAIIKSKAQGEIANATDEMNALIKRLHKLHRTRILQPDQKAEIAKIRAQNAHANKGAEEAYQLTRLQLMTKFIKEEIEVYEPTS